MQDIILETATTLANAEDLSEAKPGSEHGLDVGALDGAAKDISHLLHVGPFVAPRSLELQLRRALLGKVFELRLWVNAQTEAQSDRS